MNNRIGDELKWYDEPLEPWQPWYKRMYTLKEYCSLCEQACTQSEEFGYVTAGLYHEMKYAMQHITRKDDLLDGGPGP